MDDDLKHAASSTVPRRIRPFPPRGGSLQARYQKLATLHEISEIIFGSADVNRVLDKILERTLSVVSADLGNIRLFGPGGRVQSGAYHGYRDSKNTRNHRTHISGPGSGILIPRVLASKQSLVVENITATEGMRTFKEEGIRSAIIVPITTAEEALGVVQIGSRTPRNFRPEETRFLEAIGNQIGTAVQKARLFEETEHRAQEQAALNTIAAATSQSLRLEDLFEIALDKVLQVTRRERATIRLKDPVTGEINLRAHRGFSKGEVEELLRRKSHRISEKVFATGEPLVINDDNNPPEPADLQPLLPQSHAVAWIPIKSAVKVVGVLGVSAGQPIPFELREVQLLEAIANVIGVALENARLFQELAKKAEELGRSNAELQYFAYIASHDLQEPLRMIASYVQLLARRYKDKLDADANEFIGFAVDGATRMQALINGLLTYSRVGTQAKEFEPISCEAVLDSILVGLRTAIEESGAVITRDPLPTVIGDDTQLGQLFQNLIGNAIKFRNHEPPLIHVSAERNGHEWLFSIRDNGIGFDSQYAERIFAMFQRLHAKGKYPGTGIGLTICKKIVERHGGKIWVESQPEHGATFYFTIPQ